MIIGNKEQKLLFESILSNLEMSNSNTSAIIEHINKNEKTIPDNEDLKMDPIKAAYALNLCTVSVSQIIDYEDVVVLEQEYDAILNNLNLENMPKDDALLHILKEMLDTITFFRIQSGDKKMIEKEYQQKMKNAIWSAVPSFGVVYGGSNPWTALLYVASQVGMGYMNYRRAKASNDLEHERNQWQLQRSAIDQLNGLRRELFDASWRLSKTYGFNEEYRLTEKQISQYNAILMDPDDLRRYERLEYISEYFEAYPPFWYYLGHSANLVSQKAKKNGEIDIAEKFALIAKDKFEQYKKHNIFGLLREDLINSSCSLEYIGLLDANKDSQLINELLDSAVETSGRSNDILQLCALTYLSVGNETEGRRWLKYLVNEGYNSVVNGQLLSYLYVKSFRNGESTIEMDYKLLSSRVDENQLFPFPEGDEDDDELENDFIYRQVERLTREYALVIKHIIESFIIRFNKAIPAPQENGSYKDSFWSDDENHRNERISQYQKIIGVDNSDFVSRLEDADVFSSWLALLNELIGMLENLYSLICDDSDETVQLISDISNNIESVFKDNGDNFSSLQESMNNTFGIGSLNRLLDYSFGFFTKESLALYTISVIGKIKGIQNMSLLSEASINLRRFCLKYGIPNPDYLLLNNSDSVEEIDDVYISSSVLTGKVFDRAKLSKKVKQMALCINKSVSGIIEHPESKFSFVLKFGSGREQFKGYFRRRKYTLKYRSIIIGALTNTSALSPDLIFTADGIFIEGWRVKTNEEPKLTNYSDVELYRGALIIDDDKYKPSSLNLTKLYELIRELSIIGADSEELAQGIATSDSQYLIESK